MMVRYKARCPARASGLRLWDARMWSIPSDSGVLCTQVIAKLLPLRAVIQRYQRYPASYGPGRDLSQSASVRVGREDGDGAVHREDLSVGIGGPGNSSRSPASRATWTCCSVRTTRGAAPSVQ